jgi:hypothetical protein
VVVVEVLVVVEVGVVVVVVVETSGFFIGAVEAVLDDTVVGIVVVG